MNPKIIQKDPMIIAGTSGDVRYIGTPEIWQNFELLSKKTPLTHKVCENGYEVRTSVVTNVDETEIVYTGNAVSSENVDSEYVLIKLPASKYIVFDVIIKAPDIEGGERDVMYDWLKSHHEYKERLFNGARYLIASYDERYTGEVDGAIIEYWIPVEMK
jgi:predicted transcriptional regulator YdeE